ncbi:endo-1,4-beta-xylanase [Confluentibacter flavum]|uniref:endo-1,4-beta-xylanase n=1 Tax=Confluentibacter flavum TaxID=1909700 RepID=A0A2N3HF17_9FLAO|nr:endo-1,4-beta-xylanase [Confluentibacter flavum]PKQ43581.1 1,4-beta-xylanase [Confluentibacter flavum]
MKKLYKIWACASVLVMFISCADTDRPGFEVEKPENIAVQEVIDDYSDLKTYVDKESNPNFKLGAGISLSDYVSRNLIYRLVNRNFDEITLGYGMKHGAIVQSNGNLNLDNVNDLLATASESNISVFGHTLAWHANQNASYLNSLITPLVVTPPAIANSLDLSGLLNEDFMNWDVSNSGSGISVEMGEGLDANSQAVKLISSANASASTDLQLITPDIQVGEGTTFEVVFYIKSDKPGEGSVTFEGLTDNEPMLDWTGTGTVTETFETSISWQEVRFQITGFNASTFNAKLNLGYQPDVTYHIDVNNFYVYDTGGEVAITNLITNGDFEEGHINGWGGWGNNSTREITADGEGFGGTGYALAVTNPSSVSGFWVVQSSLAVPELEVGEEYVLSFYVKSTDVNGNIRPEMQSTSWQDGADGFGTVYLTNEWSKVELSVTPSVAGRNRLIISYGDMVGTVYLDNVVLRKAGGSTSEPIFVEKLPEVKSQIIAGALESWISQMVTNCAPHVKAWDVVNEPMDDANPYELKTGIGKSLSSDEFYWQDYMGKDYAVEAFRLAREYGNTDDILFVNDYNLEYNLDKCKGLIDYVEYIESQGQTVDGIGTQMHISINSNKENIATMFQLLAATGKFVKVSELDVRVFVDDPSEEILQQQADMYKYVVDMYEEYIPVIQRYGITVWGVTDSPANSSWLPGEKQGLWTVDYLRKPSYASFAEGLSGL